MMLMPGAGSSNNNCSYALPAALSGVSSSLTADSSAISQKDTTFTKIFVGGLPYHTSDKSLREHFEVFGEIEEAVVITDRQTSKSRGYGFVTMSDKESADRACKDPNPIIDGRKANVNLAYIGAKPRGNLQAGDWGLALSSAAVNGFRYPAMYGLQQPAGYLYQSPYLQSNAAAAMLSPLAAAAAAGGNVTTPAAAVSTPQLYEYPASAAYAANAFQAAAAAAAASDPYSQQLAAVGAFMPSPATAAAAAAAAAAAQYGSGGGGSSGMSTTSATAALHQQQLALAGSPYAAAAAAAAAAAQEVRLQ